MPNTKRGFGRVGIIVIILLALGVGAYFWSQKSAPANVPTDSSSKTLPAPTTDTPNWKTYRNVKYGFEIKYPESWKIEEVDDSLGEKNRFDLILKSPDFFEVPYPPPHVKSGASLHLTVYPWDPSLNLDNLEKTYAMDKSGITRPNKRINFAGSIALRGNSERWELLDIVKSGRLITIGYVSIGDGQSKQLFEDLISTFRFVK